MSPQIQPDFRAVFAATPGLHVLLDRDLMIVAATDAYLGATRTALDAVVGRKVFDAFPNNPDDPHASAVHAATASFDRVLRLKRPDAMPVQRHDVRSPQDQAGHAEHDAFEERYWKPLNSPVLDQAGEVRWIIHSLEDVTEVMCLKHRRGHLTPLARERRLIVERLREANELLSSLPDALFDLLADHLTPVVLARDTVIIEPFEHVQTVYFPLEGLNSMIRRLEDGTAAEVALSGRDGMVGVSVFTKDDWEETEAWVHVAGSALSIRAGLLRDIFVVNPALRMELEQCVPMLMSQMGVSVVCNARHSVDQRLARWLLTATARLGGPELGLSQEAIAMLLGIRRTGVSEALGRMTDAGLIRTGRNRITIVDEPRLEARACECFRDGEAARARHSVALVATAPIEPADIRALLDRYFALG
ncbi:MAG: helix-turn-helix domain-containing protein [Caulobacterales bacterium]